LLTPGLGCDIPADGGQRRQLRVNGDAVPFGATLRKASFPMNTVARWILGTCLGATLLVGCASTAADACCDWAGIKARSLLGSDGKDCGTIQSHPLEPRTEQLRCVKHALARHTPFMVSYHDTSKPGVEALEIALFTAQGEKVLMQRTGGGAAPQVYVGTCAEMSFAADGRIQRSGCTARPARATG
jgi:hypothetical protein